MGNKKLFYGIITALVAVGLFIAFMVMPYSCENKPVPTINIQDTLNKEIKNLKKDNDKIDTNLVKRFKQMRLDSINLVAQVSKYKTAYYRAIKTAPDTCKSYIDTVYEECNKVDSMRVKYSLKQDSTIKDLTKQKKNLELMVTKKDLIIGIKSDSISTVLYNNKKLNQANKTAKLMGWLKSAASFGGGVLAGRATK